MKEKLSQVKEFADKLSSKTKKLIIAGAVVLIVGAIALALVLNNHPYEVLFSGLGAEEAQQITQKLQDEGVDFEFDGDSTILVRENVLNQTKARLVQEGYPKSGFTYDTFKDNATLMTTDSDKKTYKLYELQDRIGSTIRLFDGVKDAKVTIALAEQSRYVLDDNAGQTASASVVVIMNDGGSPTLDQSTAIQRLVSKGVPGMEMEDVVILDGNGNDVSPDAEKSANSSDAEEIAQLVEDQIIDNVMQVLGPIYGAENVSVSARAQVNMEKLIRETTTYNTPEKIDDNDKTGIVSNEQLYEERSGTGTGAEGVAGAETNADVAEYNTDGNANGASTYSESTAREYLVNQIKEQGQVDPGALEDLTIAVAINGNGFGSLREAQIRSLVGNAAGIAADEQAQKITVVSAPFSGTNDDEESDSSRETTGGILESIPLWAIIAAAVLVVLLTAIIIILVLRSRRKAEEEEEEEEEFAEEGISAADTSLNDLNQELQEIQNDRGMELKRNVREFAEQNAEISAQLLRTWLNGGGEDGE